MSMVEVNLIKNRVLQPRHRKALYWGMLVYLGLCGALLVTVVYADTYRMIAAVKNVREAAAIRKTFKEEYPKEKDVLAFACTLQGDIETDIEQVELIQNLMDQSTHLTRILVGLTVPMTREITIDDFRLDHGARKLTFTLSAPEEHTRAATDLIATWNASTNLNREVTRFRQMSRSQAQQEGESLVLIEVEGTLRGKGL